MGAEVRGSVWGDEGRGCALSFLARREGYQAVGLFLIVYDLQEINPHLLALAWF
jgi:hypothetical protein